MTEKELEVVRIKLITDKKLVSDNIIDTPKAAVELLINEIYDSDREMFCIINLNTTGNPLNINIISVGTLNETCVSPREVFKSAILSNAASMIALHNHPSGSLKPSNADIETTEKLYKCGNLMGIKLLDHIIVGSNKSSLSMRSENYFDFFNGSLNINEEMFKFNENVEEEPEEEYEI